MFIPLKKYILLSLLLAFFSVASYSQKPGKIFYTKHGNHTDSANAHYYRIVTRGGAVDSVHDYYMNGAIRLRGTAIKIDSTYDTATLWIGRRLMYYKSGNLAADDFFDKNGRMDSVSTRYFESGKKRQLLICKNGAVVGKFYKEWDESGNCEKVFKDAFRYDDNKNQWPLNTNENHVSKIIKDSGLEMETFGVSPEQMSLDLPLEVGSRTSIETRFLFESGDNDEWHGIIWGFKDWNNYSFYFINGDGYYRAGTRYDGILSFAVKNNTSSYINQGKAENELKVLFEGGKTYYSINGVLVYETPLISFQGDRIGFFISKGKQKVLYQSIMVRETTNGETYDFPGAEKGNTDMNEFKDWKQFGSGFFIDARGYVVTNNHVVEGVKQIEIDAIMADGQRAFYKAEIVSTDKQNDFALLKITDTAFHPFPALPYNFKTEVSDVASNVFTLGYPVAPYLGVDVKFTDGKISSKTGLMGSPEAYQITVPLQPGNSGGPLFDEDGNIIGVTNGGIPGSQNVDYAIKSGYLKNFLDALSIKLVLPNDSTIANKSLTDKIKILTNYVVLIKVK